VPEVPTDPQTTVYGNLVSIEWSEPFSNGSPITEYKIFIQAHNSGLYIEETVECQGTSAELIANRICLVALDTLIISPYNLILDESIFVKIIASNYYGDSDYSDPGNGALTKLIPDAPINLVRDIATNAYTIAFTWDEGASNGGEVVINFDIYYDQALGGDYVLLEEAVTILYYQTSVSLIPDLVYSFKITARNSVGDS
jgi:hypothetical protein